MHRINATGARVHAHSVPPPCPWSLRAASLLELPVAHHSLRRIRFFALSLFGLVSLLALVLGAWWCMQ